MLNFFILLIMQEHVLKSLILIQSKNGFFTFHDMIRVTEYKDTQTMFLHLKNCAHLHLKMRTHALARI